MKLVCVTVVDHAVENHRQPMFARGVGEVLRSFVDEVNRNDPQNPLFNHPEDYSLVYVADFDDETGVFSVPDGDRRILARGKDVSTKFSGA